MSAADLVREFHQAFDLPIADTTRTHNSLRAKLIREEADEAADAIEFLGLSEQAKELADLVIVAYGAALTLGIDLDLAVTLVHGSNMSKLGLDGKPVMREDGKVLKGPLYRAPNMAISLPGAWNSPVRDASCPQCNHDDHRCPGCGEPVPHGTVACSECGKL